MAKRKKIITTAVLMALVLNVFPAFAAPLEPEIIGQSALLAESGKGTILYEQNKDKRHPADSLAKIMTLLIAASECQSGSADPGELVTMTASARADISDKASGLNIVADEEMTLLDLMYCAYVGDSEEAANLIAEHLAGSIEDFVELMNSTALSFGCKDTSFTNPHGNKYDSGQYTTAWDQFLIFREAMSIALFAEISGTYKYRTARTNAAEPRQLTGSNSMLNTNSKYYYKHNTAGKVSSTYEGGYSFVAAADTEGLSLICVVLGSDAIILEDESTQLRNITETIRLFEWGFSNHSWRTVLATTDLLAKAPVSYGDGADYVNLRPETTITLLLSNDVTDAEFTKTVIVYPVENNERLSAPVAAGTVLGEVTLSRGGTNYGTVNLVANTSIGLHRIEFVRTQVDKVLSSTIARIVISVLFVLLVGYIALVISYTRRRRAHLRKVAEKKRQIIEERQKSYKK